MPSSCVFNEPSSLTPFLKKIFSLATGIPSVVFNEPENLRVSPALTVEGSVFSIKTVGILDCVGGAGLGELNVGGIVKKNFVDACSFV